MKPIIIIVAFFVALITAISSFGTVGTGYRGVVTRMGLVTGEIKGEGFYSKKPFIESVREVNVQQNKLEVTTEAASKDLQSVKTTIALNLSMIPERAADIYQKIGIHYSDRVIAPAMQESLKAVIAQYTAEELITKREVVRHAISELIASKLTPIGFTTEAVNIVNFEFSHSFNAAIEAKVTAEQNALAAQNQLRQKEFEAAQAVATARGKAESMAIENKALAENSQILQLRALERWDGKLPQVTGGSIPFISLTAEQRPEVQRVTINPSRNTQQP